MTLSTILGLVHAAAAALALLSIGQVVRARRRSTQETRGTGWLLATLGSAAVWSAHLAWWYLLGVSEAQLLWLPAVGATMGGLLAWSAAVLRPEHRAPRLWIVVWLLDPALLVAAQLWLAPGAVAVRYDDRIDYGWFFGVHVLVTFAMMLATVSLWAGSRSDPSPTLRLLGRIVIAGVLAAGVAQVLQLMVLDLVLAVTGAVVVVLVVRAGPDALRPRPRAAALLDGLGALVLVFDRDDGLVDLNAPARAFFARRDGAPPTTGTSAADLLPVPVDDALVGVEVRLGAPDGAVDFMCFAARLGPSTSPPHGSVVVLRSANPPEAPRSSGAPQLAVLLAQRIEQLTADLGVAEPLVVLGLSFRCAEDAERAARAIEFVVGSLDLLVVGLVGECSLVAVAPAHVEPYLVDVAAGWQPPRADDAGHDDGTVRSVSLSPVLAGEQVLRHGPAAQAAALVGEVRRDLSGRA